MAALLELRDCPGLAQSTVLHAWHDIGGNEIGRSCYPFSPRRCLASICEREADGSNGDYSSCFALFLLPSVCLAVSMKTTYTHFGVQSYVVS
jgi:hypothetical protein